MNLKTRIERLEETVSSKDIFFPPLFYSAHRQTLDQAKEKYLKEHGFDFPDNDNGMIIEIVRADCRRKGNENEESGKKNY